jgi:hypothetical protein
VAETSDERRLSRRRALSAVGAVVPSVVGCVSSRERVQIGYMRLSTQDLDETITASLRILKDGTEQLDETYQLSPDRVYEISHDWMRDSPGRFTVEFTASNTDERERREFPNRLGGGCYGVSLRVRGEQLLVLTDHTEAKECRPS